MKYTILKLLLLISLFSSSFAYEHLDENDYTFNVDSLIGFEGGYTSFDVERIPDNGDGIKKYNMGHIGLKLGAQTHNYRIFISIRDYFPDTDYDYFLTYGGEFQYLFNFSKIANFYVGINAGMLDGRFKIEGENSSRTIYDPYFGGDIGFNFHLSKTVDLELGGRVLTSNAENKKDNITYKFDNLVSGYASIIIRFHAD